MLLDNFKLLIDFYPDSSFKNVLGNTVTKKSFLAGQEYQDPSQNQFYNNGHTGLASTLTYNYGATENLNECEAEKTSYPYGWAVSNNNAQNTKTISNAKYRFNGMVLFVGTGDTPATANDYCLDNSVVLTPTSSKCTHTANLTTEIERTFKNNTGDAVTIKEVGAYIFAAQYGNLSSDNYFPIVMIGRKVITPVTIANNETYTFKYTIDFNNITYGDN